MLYCCFCGLGFFESEERASEARDSSDMNTCEACFDKLFLLQERPYNQKSKALEYFVKLLVDGVMLKGAYRELLKNKLFEQNFVTAASMIKPSPNQRQDGKKAVKFSYSLPIADGQSNVLPPMYFKIPKGH